MKFSAQEEYGLRCLIAIAQKDGTTIPEISKREGLTEPHVAKLLTTLRKGGLVTSTRGQVGGFALSEAAEKISLSRVMDVLGGRLYDDTFCERHSGKGAVCNHAGGCSLKSLWSRVQDAVDDVLLNVTLADVLEGEAEEASVQMVAAVPAGIRGRNG